MRENQNVIQPDQVVTIAEKQVVMMNDVDYTEFTMDIYDTREVAAVFDDEAILCCSIADECANAKYFDVYVYDDSQESVQDGKDGNVCTVTTADFKQDTDEETVIAKLKFVLANCKIAAGKALKLNFEYCPIQTEITSIRSLRMCITSAIMKVHLCYIVAP